MTPVQLLDHYDQGQLWPATESGACAKDVAQAYQAALAVRQLRIDRGELPRGFKIGFTNSSIWPRYQVFAPIWGTVWNTTLLMCEGEGEVALTHMCQPRIEPELVFGMRATPAPDAGLQDLFDAIDWFAPGFEIVQSHLPDWKFNAAQAVSDGALHARLVIGARTALRDGASDAAQLDQLLADTQLQLSCDGTPIERGQGSNVLGSPLRALHHFLLELRQTPGAPDLMPGDVVTTGTWTDAWPVVAGQRWSAKFDAPLAALSLRFV